MSCHYDYVLLFFIVFCFAKLSLSRTSNYERYKVLTITPRNERQLNFLLSLDDPEYDFWKEPRGISFPADLMVPPRLLSKLGKSIKELNLDYFVTVPNVQKMVNSYMREKRRHPRSPVGDNWADFFTDFREMNDIYGFMNHMAKSFPEIVTVNTIGNSFEGKPLQILIIGKKRKLTKAVIWIDGGIHGREWITPAAALYIAHQLIAGYGKSDEATRLVNSFEWHILPVVNPDGYEYSRLSGDKLWRKNRRPVTSNGVGGIGVDLNRNFPYKWNGTSDEKASDVSSLVYAGSNAGSEIEVQAIVNYLSGYKKRLSAFVSLHSFVKSWLHPWAYTKRNSRHYEILRNVSLQVVHDIYKETREIYYKGSIGYLSESFGCSMDWAHGDLGVIHSYTFELRDYDSSGFFPPPSEIVPISKEAWIGVKKMAHLIDS